MGGNLPIWLMEPELTEKRELTARKLLLEDVREAAPVPEKTNLDEVKERLVKIRRYTRDHMEALAVKVKTNLRRRYPQVKVASAPDNATAVQYITEISDGIKTISINNSRLVTKELKTDLIANGFTVIESYLDEFDVNEKKTLDYWELPHLNDRGLVSTFGVTDRMTGLPATEIKNYMAVLGVNALSAKDTTVFFLQHFSNIKTDLKQAKKVVLIVGLDRIVKNREDAAFQVKSMGIFGLESILLGIQPRTEKTPTIAELPLLTDDKERELHLILLDNYRTGLAQSDFRDLSLCIGCRTCTISCPAYLSGKPLSPREVVLNFKKNLSVAGSAFLSEEEEGEDVHSPLTAPEHTSASETITQDEIWACTTCHACQENCPVQIKHTEAIVSLRQNLVMDQTVIPDTAEVALRSIEARGHPWRGTMLTRTDWTEGLDIKPLAEDSHVDMLYWVGCTEALEDRSLKVAQATGKLLTLAGIKLGILGDEESCCGDPARRLGNEYLFQIQAEKNIEALKRYHVKKIVTACPHCYNMIKNEYPQFGGDFKVIHHIELIAQLVKEGKIKTGPGAGEIVTYHDACYLGRYNGIYEPPRQILNSLPRTTPVEMEPNKQRSFCCGGGGGRMWLEENTGRRISEMRIERAIETRAQTVVTACPFCLQMFDDAIKAKAAEESLKVMDIAELVNLNLKKDKALPTIYNT